jgi:beta-lactamase regulating signal transducer with metallopeptidase domain
MLPVASLIYLILLVLPVFNFIRNYRYVQVIRQHKLSKTDVEWRIFVKNVAARMGIKKTVHIWLSGIVTSPVTIGYLKPVILLPLAAVNHLNTQQIEAILLHELAHIRRYDYLLNLVIRFIQVILYFNPFVKAFIKIIERERELSCDEMVIQFQYDPYGYASALLTLEKNNHHPKPLAVAASGNATVTFALPEAATAALKETVTSLYLGHVNTVGASVVAVVVVRKDIALGTGGVQTAEVIRERRRGLLSITVCILVAWFAVNVFKQASLL